MSSVTRGATVLAMPTATTETYRPFNVAPPKVTQPCGDPVGVQEIAERLGLESRSVHMIGRRGQLPEPDYMTNGFRAWEWNKVLWWAGETDRLRSPALVSEYITVFGHGPMEHATRSSSSPGPKLLKRTDAHPKAPVVPSKAPKAKVTKVTKAAAAKPKAKKSRAG